MFDHLKTNAAVYICTATLGFAGLGLLAFMDQRHDAAGSSAAAEERVMEEVKSVETNAVREGHKRELRQLRREKRKLEGYQRLSPNSEYSASRAAEIDALVDEIAEIEMELEEEQD